MGASGRQSGLALLLLAAALCAGFAALGSAVVLAYELAQGGADSGFLFRTALKAAGFSVLTLMAAWGVYAVTRAARQTGGFVHDPGPEAGHAWWGLAAALLLGALIALPRLDAMPRAEPDELHHLIVARNLGLEGRYASGDAASGWLYFDPYDSVGAPVIVPAALAMRVAGVDVTPPRAVIALYFLLLIAAAYFLAQPVAGGPAAALGAALLALAPMSPYLARTLYGEAPGLAWVLVGLVCWRVSWTRCMPWAVIAGVAFGCAVLCKAYLVIFALATAAACLLDAWTYRRISLTSLVGVAAGGAAILGVWIAFTLSHGNGETAEGGTLDVYRHLLLFGLGGAGNAAAWFLQQPLMTAGLLAAALAPLPAMMGKRYDPALIAAWLFAVFVVFWFAFFTPGHIPRYLWYAMAMFGLLFGIVLRDWTALRRPVTVGAAIILLTPFVARNVAEVGRMYTGDEMSPERAVARFVADVPPHETVATAFWPLERIVAFYNGAPIPRAAADAPADVILYNRHNQPAWLEDWEEVAVFGRYAAARPPES